VTDSFQISKAKSSIVEMTSSNGTALCSFILRVTVNRTKYDNCFIGTRFLCIENDFLEKIDTDGIIKSFAYFSKSRKCVV